MINQRIDTLLKEFSEVSDWEERYRRIIAKGKNLAPLPEAARVEGNKVKGCQSQVWLFAELNQGKVIFHADSDASIVKGIIALLLEVYSDSTPDEILQTEAKFIDQLELKQHLSMNRSNGLAAMLKQISIYAFAFKTKMQMGLA